MMRFVECVQMELKRFDVQSQRAGVLAAVHESSAGRQTHTATGLFMVEPVHASALLASFGSR